MENSQLIAMITEAAIKQICHRSENNKIPVAISNRHVHLSQRDIKILFGEHHTFKIKKVLSQPKQYACEEKVTLVGVKGVIENVRILGPSRTHTQVEISVSDGIKLGISPPVRDSGDLANSASITLVGPLGCLTLQEGVIVAARHIHMHTTDAERFGVKDKERISVTAAGPRGLVFNETLIRVSEHYRLEMHIDIDEANAASLHNQDYVEIHQTHSNTQKSFL
ncbi:MULTISPECIES: phosphate propanoyltransferase [Desulfitobacterium]|uniref:Phosphate propanoyltransferase n=1 Tax=Desulfitobacterium dehalogenans (strain ATCC 51507 / DSM 9161 / JW/IU-DC1) TaxID=756499 RepID=I4A4D7_DESDJ|nr:MULTISPECIES: phosphate propanoyltransferase [Desulfitobacterium]AFL98821.1 propanediol utilization protein [Desulfitobacterium dehalogenans ATCC 51507]